MSWATMCPSVPVAPPNSIEYHAGDTEVLKHLLNLILGDPHPVNVLTCVDPYNALPWNLPPRVFYFLNSQNDKSFKGEEVFRTTVAGYWHVTGKGVITLTQSQGMGWKTTLEFYRGQAPHGDKTGWVMHEYTMDKVLGFSSLCRVFERCDGSHSNEHPNDDADGELLQAQLLSMLEYEDSINNLQDFSNMSRVVNGNERGPPAIIGSHLQSLPRPHNSAQDPDGGFDFSEGYIEWNDISGGASSSSRSENSFASSMTLDDYIELCDLETPIIPDTTKEQNADCRFSVSASQGSHQVLINPPPSAPLGGGSSSKRNPQNPHAKNNMVYAPMPSVRIGESNNTHRAASIPEELPSRKVPTQGSTAYDINRVNQFLPNAYSVSARCNRVAVGGTIEPRKKYGCFIGFQFLSSVSAFFSRKGKKWEKEREERKKKH